MALFIEGGAAYTKMAMYQTTPIIVLSGDSQAAITLITEILVSAGLQVVRSFDLQVARATHTQCKCPHHGTDQCNCQLVVLLVYEKEDQPVTLVAHGYDGETQLAFVDSPNQHPNPALITTIRQTLSHTKSAMEISLRLNPHAT